MMFATKDLLAADVHRLPILAMSSGMINGESLRRRLGLDLDDDGAAPDVLFDDGAATGVLFDVCSITKIHYNTTINSQNQFENNKCITFPSASSSLIRFSNASAFAVASSRSFVRCSIRRLKSSAGTTEPSDPDATAPAPLDPLIGWRWKRRALDWLAMEKESRARLQVHQQRPAKLR